MYIGQATTNTIFYKFTYNTAISTVSAAGMTTDCFNFKTGTNAQFGTALQTNNMKLAVPKSSQSGALIGNKCIYISSATFGFHFLVTDLSNGSTTTPSQVTWNKLGTGTDYAAITYAQACWSNILDCEINYSSASGCFMMKRSINNDPNMQVFGRGDMIYEEVAGTKHPANFAGITTTGIFMSNGVLMANSTVAGQRGIYALNIAADKYFAKTYTGVVGPSYMVTPVISIDCAKAIASAMVAEYRNAASAPSMGYRTSGFATFPNPNLFTDMPANNDLSSVGGLAHISQVQLIVYNTCMGDYGVNSQLINEIILAYIGKFDVSDYWRVQVDNTSMNGASPVTVATKQVTAYSGGAQTIYFDLYDSSKNLITTLNTTTHYAQFKKSTDGGTSFSNMTGANDYTNSGAGTTVIQLNWAAPVAGVTIVGIRDVN
jgi:hypothetical protein